MARGINKVILVGNVGNDPEVKYTQGGMAVAKCSMATTTVRKDRDGNQQENTEWHRVTFFGKLAEIVGEYVQKGSQIYVEGGMHYDKYTDKDGIERYTSEVRCNEMQMLGGGSGRDGGGGTQQRRDQGRSPPPRQSSAPPRREAAPPRREQAPSRNTPSDFGADFADDDIPF